MVISLHSGGVHALADTSGAELVSFQDSEGTEHLWQGDSTVWSGRNPILFPAVGALKGGGAFFDHVFYPLSRHGFVRGKEFAVTARGDDFVEFTLCENQQTLEQYPYLFQLVVRHTVTEESFSTAFAVRNTGPKPMPYCIGGHTAYRCPLRQGESFEEYSLVFDKEEEAGSIAVTEGGLLAHRFLPAPRLHRQRVIDLQYQYFDEADTLIFEGLRSRSVTLVNRRTSVGTRVSFGDFPMLAIWTMPHRQAPYLCIEPWQGCAGYEDESGVFTEKPHCVVLRPGQERCHHYTAEINVSCTL